jgi:hypothetical protein
MSQEILLIVAIVCLFFGTAAVYLLLAIGASRGNLIRPIEKPKEKK